MLLELSNDQRLVLTSLFASHPYPMTLGSLVLRTWFPERSAGTRLRFLGEFRNGFSWRYCHPCEKEQMVRPEHTGDECASCGSSI